MRLIEGAQNFAKVGFVKKENFSDKFNESKLSHERDCHRFDEYKYEKPLWKYLETTAKLRVPRKTYLGCFSKNTLSHS